MNDSSRPALLEARDLSVTPPGGREPVVRGVSLAIARGEWVALAGPNGGGKTSLLLALAGLWPATGGSVIFDGAPLSADPAARNPGIAVVLQDPASQLLQGTVADELAFTARNLGLAEPVIAAALRHWCGALGIEDELGRDPLTLSAGRQQLVLLAAALIPEPRLLCADEPTAHLDPEARTRVRVAIAGRVAAGLTVVWASQDPEELAAADWVVTVGARSPAGGPPASKPEPSRTPEPAADTALRLSISPDTTTDGPRVRVAEAIVIEVAARGVTALLGPNGAGKSVVLTAASGLGRIPQIELQWSAPPEQPAIVALQYPELQIFEEVVADELVFAAVSRGCDRSAALRTARECIVRLDLDPEAMLARRTWSLSTGEKRLIEVIGALIAPASLVVLDEPTAGLDSRRRAALADLVRERSAEVPVLIATQDREWIAGLATREFVLETKSPIRGKSQAKKRLTEPC